MTIPSAKRHGFSAHRPIHYGAEVTGTMESLQVRRAESPSAISSIWAAWLVVVLFLALLNPLITDSLSLAGTVAVFVHMLASVAILIVAYPLKIAVVLTTSLALRVGIVFWDLNLRHIAPVLHSGLDSENYFRWAVRVGDDLSLLSQETTGGGLFSSMFGLLFHAIGPMRVFAQYTNALFGLTIVLLVLTMLRSLDVREPIRSRIFVLAALLPNPLILSAVFLRESVIAVLVAASLFHFVKWFLQEGPWRIVVSFLLVLLASAFHSGVVPIALGYAFAALFYNRDTGQFRLGIQSLPYLAIFSGIVSLSIIRYPDLFLGKFEAYESESQLIWATNFRHGGSAYLTDLVVNSHADIIRFGPLRAFYFLASPVPWDFRSLADAITFFFDSMLYLGALFVALRNYRHLGHRKPLIVALLVIVGLASFVFGAGVSNAGTALRHRYKLVSIFLILAAVAATKSDPSGMRTTAPGRSLANPIRSRRQTVDSRNVGDRLSS